jgi:hypothetical protein
MRKGVSEADLHNALTALSRAVVSRRMSRQKAATLAYLGLVLFQSDQLITQRSFALARVHAGIVFAHFWTSAPSMFPLSLRADTMLRPAKSNHSATYATHSPKYIYIQTLAEWHGGGGTCYG